MKKLLLLVLISLPLLAQNIKEVRKNINTLCSPGFHGRGYVANGDHIARAFLQKKFDSLGLQSFSPNFQQNFSFPINTFPGAMEFKSNGKAYVTGKDYIIQAFSGSAKGDYKPLFLDSNDMDQLKALKKLIESGKIQEYVVVLDAIHVKNSPRKKEYLNFQYVLANYAPVIILDDQKLTWSMSMEALPFPIITTKDIQLNKKDAITLNIENKLIPQYESSNLIAYVPGTEVKDSFLVFSAHYDHLGHMGADVYIPGANDNASGTAMLLDLAAHYVQNPAKYSVAFIAFGAEEVGLIGSKYYTENPLFPLNSIKFLINVDIMGTGDDGITVVNGAIHPEAFDQLVAFNEQHQLLKEIKKRGKAQNSDHYYFTEKGVPAFFIYTRGGISAYHDIFDQASTLPLTKYEACFQLIQHFISSF